MEAFHLCSLKRARLTPLLSSANCPSWQSLQKAVLAHPGTEGGVKPHQLGKLGRPSQASESLSFPVLLLVRFFQISFSVFSICFCCCCSFCLLVFVLSFAIFALCFLLLQFKEVTMKKLSGSRFMSPCHHPLWLYNKKGTCGPF